MTMKHFIKGAFVMLALAVLFCVGRAAVISAAEYAGVGNQWPGKIFFEDDVNVNDAFTKTPTTATEALTASKDVAKYDVSAAGGAYVISLPASGTTDVWADGQCTEFSMTVAGAAVSFSPSAVGDLLDASQAAYAGMDALGDSVLICYDAGTTNYYFQSRYIH